MPEIEFLIVANHVEALNGLLYISGGGWTDHYRPLQPGGTPFVSHVGVGVSVLVPWNDTNVYHQVFIALETEDGTELARLEPTVSVGRPPGLTPGADQRAVLALNLETAFEAAGGYRFVAGIQGGAPPKSVAFRVHDVPLPAGAGGPQPPA